MIQIIVADYRSEMYQAKFADSKGWQVVGFTIGELVGKLIDQLKGSGKLPKGGTLQIEIEYT